jgi:membrane protein implicated in regulation of membrane protease activity
VGRLTPFLDDIVLAVVLLLLFWLLAPGLLPWALVGALCYSAAKVWLFRSHLLRPAVGSEAMPGRIATALGDLAPTGQVSLDGEIWEAESSAQVRAGEKVRVEGLEGLTLKVGPLGVAGPGVREPRQGSWLLALADRLRRE